MPREVEILAPDYYGGFACIGPACRDNCCHSWEVDVDKESYLRYRAEKDPEFRAMAVRLLRRRKDGTPERYATLGLEPDGRCGFQDPDGGCRLIRLLGEGALCRTCTLYPRRKAEFTPGVWELSLSLSCGEAARLALFRDRVEFVRQRRPFRPGDPMDEQPPLGIGKEGAPAAPPLWAPSLRRACLDLLRLRDYPLAERVMAAGLLLRRADRLLGAGEEAGMPALCASFLGAVERGDFRGFFGRLDYSREAHLAALRLPMAHLLAGARKPVLRHLREALAPYCREDPATGELLAGEEALAFLLSAAKEKGDPLLAELAVPAENYLVTYAFSGLFPFLYHSEGLSFEENGVLLAEQYALLRLLLALSPEELPKEERLIRAAVSLSRLTQHADLGRDLRALTRALRLDGLAHGAYLLR